MRRLILACCVTAAVVSAVASLTPPEETVVVPMLTDAAEPPAPPPDQYRFDGCKDDVTVYQDGTILPSMTCHVQRLEGASWRTVGYWDVHLHKVKRDSEDIEDVSFGFTARANPKK